MLENISYYKLFMYSLVIIVLSIIIYYIVNYFKKHPISNFINDKGLQIKNHNSHQMKTIDNEKILHPLLDNEFSFSFTIYINNIYENMNFWKHIFHKGTIISKDKSLDYKNWSDIENNLPEQSVGVWLFNNINNMRIAVTTDNDYSSLEYIDIYDIPSKTKVHITIVVKNFAVEVYKNGLLLNTKVFKNKPIFNDKDLYLTFKKTFDGMLYKFNYIPKALSVEEVKELK